jgi:hypothetical protein
MIEAGSYSLEFWKLLQDNLGRMASLVMPSCSMSCGQKKLSAIWTINHHYFQKVGRFWKRYIEEVFSFDYSVF